MALKAKTQKRVPKPVNAKKLAGAVKRAKQSKAETLPVAPKTETTASTANKDLKAPTYQQIDMPGTEPGAIVARSASEAEPLTMVFRSSAEVRIAILALVDREKQLDGLAKKNSEAGYPKEALVQKQDRAIIQRRLLPQLQPQITMGLDANINIVDVCTEVVGRELRSNLRRVLISDAVARLTSDGVANARTVAEEQVNASLEQFEEYVGKIAELTGAACVPLLDGLYQNAFTIGRLVSNSSPAQVTQELALSLRDGVNELVA